MDGRTEGGRGRRGTANVKLNRVEATSNGLELRRDLLGYQERFLDLIMQRFFCIELRTLQKIKQK